MSLIEVNRDISERQLLISGFLLAAFLGLVGAVLYWQFELPRVAVGVWCVGAVLVLAYFAVPAWRRPIYLGWLYAVFPIGWVVSHAILLVVYYGLFTPVGLIMRMIGRDPLNRTLDPEASTYWTEKPENTDAERYYHQY